MLICTINYKFALKQTEFTNYLTNFTLMKKYLYLLTAIILMASVQTVFAQKTKLMNKQQFNDNITETNNVKPQKGQSVKVPKYVDLGLPSGTLWATFNIGASAPEEAGLFFAWGETEPKDNYTWTNYQHCDGTYLTMNKYCTDDYYGTVDGKTQLEPADDAATVLLGKGWSMPTKEQFEELVYNDNKYTTCTITTQNSVQGLLVTSVINDASIFLPIGGYHDGTGIYNTDRGYYWTSNVYEGIENLARSFSIDNPGYSTGDSKNRRCGLNIRPVYTPYTVYATFNLGVQNGISVPEGYFNSVGEKWSWNNKFNGGEYDGISFSKGLKMEDDTKIGFTTEDVSVVTIVQSTYSDATIKFDNEELPVGTAEAGTGCRIYTLKNVPAGDHVIGRGSGESGLFYVKMKDVNVKTVTFINDAGWDNVYVWAWNDYENFTGGSWPGEKLTANGEGKYVWSTLGEPTKILFNDGGSDQTADLDFVDGGVYKSTGCINSLNSYTVTFKTNLVWESVYAYAWSGDGDTAVKFLGDWPGTKVTDVDDSNDDYDIYTLTFEAATAPEKIIFSNGVGGKVGRTQTADLEFVDGKEYSLIYVPSALMEHALELADSADEGEALDKLLEAIQYAFDNDDESQLQAAIDQFIADTEKANYFIEFPEGKYYIIDAETDMKIAAGGSFGTHGIVNERGLDLWLTPYTESRTVTIDSRVNGGGNSHFLSQNLFMDSEEWGWGLVYQGFGFYIKDPNSGKYINIDEDNNLVLSDTPHEWIIVTDEGVRVERLDELAEATIDDPKDATFLITAPNFNRNDQRNAEAWDVSGNCTLSTGNGVNNCATSSHSAFTISQSITDAPVGLYELTAQGFYRQDDGVSESAPQLFIGNEKIDLPLQTGSETDENDASNSFTKGLYNITPILFSYEGDGDLTIGISGTAEHQWVVFDNFRLTYLTSDTMTGIKSLEDSKNIQDTIFNLAGQRLNKPVKGVNIINRKKVLR